jgi:hypothetical protein
MLSKRKKCEVACRAGHCSRIELRDHIQKVQRTIYFTIYSNISKKYRKNNSTLSMFSRRKEHDVACRAGRCSRIERPAYWHTGRASRGRQRGNDERHIEWSTLRHR